MTRPIWTLDAETDPFAKNREPHPFLWCVYDGAKYHLFRRVKEVVEFLRDKRVIVYAHNGGRFDYMARDCRCRSRPCKGTDKCLSLVHFLEPCDEITIINGRLAKFKIGACEFRDSWNILPVKLEKFGKMKVDYGIFEEGLRDKPENHRKIVEYLKFDCLSLHNAVTEYVSRFGLNLTQAGGALKFWSKLTERDPPKSTKEFYEAYQKYYFGGRVQCFRKGVIDTRFSVVDINSAYPYAMLDYHPFSTDDPLILEGTNLRGAGVDGPMFYDVECVSLGAFPYRDPDSGKLNFPNDPARRLYHVTWWELKAALELNMLRDWTIKKGLRFTEAESFKGYVMHCYNERLKATREGDATGKELWKLLMNSLYGKWGAHPSDYREYRIYEAKFADVLDDAPPDEFGRKETCAGRLGPWALGARELLASRQNFYNVATSASITGFVRAHLLRAMTKCSGVLYCDTDSIAAANVAALPLSDRLGDWKVEGRFKRAAIAGRKLYAFEHQVPVDEGGEIEYWKVRSKGARLDAEDIVKVARGAVVEYQPEAPTFSAFHAPRFINREIRLT